MKNIKNNWKTTTNIILCFPFLLAILIYQRLISLFLPPSCIYWPSCSEYARQAFKKHGLLAGVYLSFRRLARCHPFGRGGTDEVPEHFSFFS